MQRFDNNPLCIGLLAELEGDILFSLVIKLSTIDLITLTSSNDSIRSLIGLSDVISGKVHR